MAVTRLYLMREFYHRMVHDSLLEAARIDGASEFRIYAIDCHAVVKPAWLTLIIWCSKISGEKQDQCLFTLKS